MGSEAEMEAEATKLHENREFMAAIVFLNSEGTRDRRDVDEPTIPKHVQYKIRMDIDHVEATQELQEL